MDKFSLAEILQNKNVIMFLTTMIYILGLYAYFTKASILFAITITIIFLLLIIKNFLSVKLILFWLSIFYLGFFNCVIQIKNSDNLSIYSPSNCTITGEITSIPKENEYNTKFYFYAKSININGKEIDNINSNVFVSVKNENKPLNLQIRDSYKIKGSLREPFKAGNPSQFDYSDYLKNFDTHNVFYADYNNVEQIQNNNSFINNRLRDLNKLRNRIIETHSKYLKYPSTEILGGIIFGDDAVSPPEFIKISFINSGLLHILAASGMNVAFIYGFWYFIFRTLFRVPFKITTISGIFMIILYSLMTGLGASVIRAAAMLIFILVGKLINRDTHSVALLSMVALIMLLYNPAYINNISFQLSFIVTFGLLISFDLSSKFSNKILKWVISSISVPFIAQIWVIPLQMYYFNTISLYAIFANILITPFLAVTSFLGFLSSVISIIKPLSDFICKYTDFVVQPCINIIVHISDYFGKLPNSMITTTHPNIFQVIIYYTIILLLILNIHLGFKHKKVILATIIMLIVLPASCINIPSKYMELIVFDVQNADAFLIKSPENKYFMIDTGKSGYNGGNSQAKTIIIKYLKDRGIKNLEGLIITHFDNDHSGGAPDILDYANVKTVYLNDKSDKTYTSKQIFDKLKDKNVKIAKNNEVIYKEGNFKITTYRKPITKNDNENSIIAVLTNDKINYLMMGDASMTGLKDIPQHIQILKVGHHGAKSVVDTNMLKSLNIETAIVSTGINKFGHPNPLTLNQLKDLKVYRTDKNNSIKIVSNGDSYNVYTFDRDKKKYVTKS